MQHISLNAFYTLLLLLGKNKGDILWMFISKVSDESFAAKMCLWRLFFVVIAKGGLQPILLLVWHWLKVDATDYK